ncbi:MAG: hypothetical protein HY301_03785 [Verrucomicrobia bacterium]|nr:hypothetical protein [Verrucomicrobiota bacterium]
MFITEVPVGEFYATRVPLAEFFTLTPGRYRLDLEFAVDHGAGDFQTRLALTNVAFEIRER